MNTRFIEAKVVDAKSTAERRYRNIVANSGLEMESGEVRELDILHVMTHDGKLVNVNDLAKDPAKQTESYSVKAATNHGHIDPTIGALVVDVEDIIGDCKVWTEEDGLHARMYFANDDPKADHAWAVSENASYSIGTEWYPDGYYGAGLEIEEPVGILREISMVSVGNDPRAKTIDNKSDKGAEGTVGAVVNTNDNGGSNMIKKLDELTPDEREAMGRRIAEVIDDFTTDAPESQTEPTARESKDAEGEVEAEAPTEAPAEDAEAEAKEEKKDVLNMPITVIQKSDAKQEVTAVKTADWRLSQEATGKFAELAGKYKKFDSRFSAAWEAELREHNASTTDGITGLALPVDGRSLFVNAIENGTTDSARIIGHFRNLGGKSYLIQLIEAVGAANGAETARAHGFKKGDSKINQELNATPRSIYNKMVYKKLDLDALEAYENPELIQIRAEELVNLWYAEIARAAIIGDGRVAPGENEPDYRMFDGTRGFYSMVADATAEEGFGSAMATAVTVPVGSNLYDASVLADSAITAEGRMIAVAKKSIITDYRQAKKANGDYVVAPGARVEDSLGVSALYTPSWMNFANVDVVFFKENTYGLTGEANPTMRPDFDTTLNQDILLVEGPRGGSLIAKNAAAALTFATGPVSE